MRTPSLPQSKITITRSGVDYSFEKETLQFEVVLRENAVSSLSMTANDYQSKTFLGRCDVGDNVKVEFRFKDETDSYTQLFGGWIEPLQPSLTKTGELIQITAYGYGIALKNMLVREQYGTQSDNNTLNTILEALTDATHGIIPKYVNKVMASATNSGYSIDTTKVADLTSDFRYLYFTGKPAINCLNDMIDLVAAANTPNAGCHWIVVPDNGTARLALATVKNHENPPSDIWSTWWNPGVDEAESRTKSTIEVKKDMVISSFTKQRSEANYVLFVGNFRRPANGDVWTEGSATTWDCDANGVLADDSDAADHVVGANSLSFTKATSNGKFWYPKTGTLDFNITEIETPKTVPVVSFYIMQENLGADPNLMVHMMNDNTHTDYYSRSITGLVVDDNKWYHITLPIGTYYTTIQKDNVEWLENSGNETWADIDHVGFCIVGGETAKVWVDGFHIDGVLTRAAYDSGKYASQKCRMMFLRDDIPKDDSLLASDDSGQMAQFCKAELFRSAQEPIVGKIVIPMRQTIKAGQFARIHFGKKSNGDFRIDKDMRIVEVRHQFSNQGALSVLSLSDDEKNSIPRAPTDAYNTLMKAVAPKFQDRLRTSIIGGDIDISQTILAKSYST